MAYLLKNRSLERTSKQLVSIAGVVGVNLVMGGIQETSIDNIGMYLTRHQCILCLKADCLR